MWAVECEGEAPKVSFGFSGFLMGVFFVGDLAGYCIGRWYLFYVFFGFFLGVLVISFNCLIFASRCVMYCFMHVEHISLP